MRNFLWKAILPLTVALALQGCKKPETGRCDDGKDNDKNGQTDCDDDACAADPGCVPPAEVCDNGIDDDDDGAFDCVDDECANFAGCVGGPCVADGDCGGDAPDCLDEDTTGFPAGYCIASCADDADCEGGFCLPVQGGGLCVGACDVAADCRDAYDCVDLGDGATFACLPACTADAQCTVNEFCDTDANSDTVGLCIDAENCAFNDVDDDLDGLIDCADNDCANDAGCIAAIGDACDAAGAAVEGANAGDTNNGTNLFVSSCGGGGQEEIFTFTPAASGDVEFVLSSATDLGVYARSTCEDGGTELDCADVNFGGDDEAMTLTVTAGTAITLFVDAFTAADDGAYTLTITPVICGDGIRAGGEQCDDNNVATGDGCSDLCEVEDGFSCDNTVSPTVCTDLAVVCTDETTAIANIGDTTTGDNIDGIDFFNGSCTGGGLEDLFSLVPGNAGQTGVLTLTLVSATDLGVYARTTCALDDTELGCADVAFPGGPVEDTETLNVNISDASAAVTIFVDAFLSGEEGPYTLTAAFVADNCGDGQTTGGEGCDDGNATPLDGCSDTCQVEGGFACDNTVSPSECTDLNVVCLAADPAVIGVASTGDTADPNATALFLPTNAGAVQDCDFNDTGSGTELLFSFTPLADGNLTLTLDSGPDADHAVYVRTTCVDDATEVGCADIDFPAAAGETSQEVLTIAVTGGVPLTIFVDTFQDFEGTFTLNLQ